MTTKETKMDRAAVIARLTWIMPELDDDGLDALHIGAETLLLTHRQPLDGPPLMATQQAREASASRALANALGSEVMSKDEARSRLEDAMGRLWVQTYPGLAEKLASTVRDAAFHAAQGTCPRCCCADVHGLAEAHDREMAAQRAQVEALSERIAAFTAPVDVEAEAKERAGQAWLAANAGRLTAWFLPRVEREAQLARRVAELERVSAEQEATIKRLVPDDRVTASKRFTAAEWWDVEGPARRAAVDAAAERLGLVHLAPGSEAYQAREVLFSALGALLGADVGIPREVGHDGIGVGCLACTYPQAGHTLHTCGRQERTDAGIILAAKGQGAPPAVLKDPLMPAIFDCGCSHLKVRAGMCDIYDGSGRERGAR